MKCLNCNKNEIDDKNFCLECLSKIHIKDFQFAWDGLKSMNNEDDNLVKKAEVLAFITIYLSERIEKEMFDWKELEIKKYKKRKYKNELAYEFLFFIVHLIDRLSFEVLGEHKRAEFMDCLIPKIATEFILDSYNSNQKVSILHSLDLEYNKKQAEYGKYKKIMAEKDDGLRNTLIYEFSKKIAGMVSEEYDMAMIFCVTEYVIKIITVLNLQKLFLDCQNPDL
jgi:hypothetical protein